MKEDIPNLKVEEMAIAIVPRSEMNDAEALWDTYILNFREAPIQNVLINSKGYGELEGETRKTTILRHFFEEIGPAKAMLIEPIQAQLFDLTNEYWVSFTFEGHMYDKKYVFVRGSITEDNFTTIPFIEQKGVMIR